MAFRPLVVRTAISIDAPVAAVWRVLTSLPCYSLAEAGDRTTLAIEIGDFAELAHGQDFYEASLDFGYRASSRIRELAEAGRSEGLAPGLPR